MSPPHSTAPHRIAQTNGGAIYGRTKESCLEGNRGSNGQRFPCPPLDELMFVWQAMAFVGALVPLAPSGRERATSIVVLSSTVSGTDGHRTRRSSPAGTPG